MPRIIIGSCNGFKMRQLVDDFCELSNICGLLTSIDIVIGIIMCENGVSIAQKRGYYVGVHQLLYPQALGSDQLAGHQFQAGPQMELCHPRNLRTFRSSPPVRRLA